MFFCFTTNMRTNLFQPCTRLNKSCDWDQRWNFSDATRSTQTKYSKQVSTVGSTVWDRKWLIYYHLTLQVLRPDISLLGPLHLTKVLS